MGNMVRLRPNAKINLGLFIKGRLPNGYHTLETLLYPLKQLCDIIEIEEDTGGDCSLDISGLEIEGSHRNNLCYRAWAIMKKIFPDLPGVSIRLEKHIPMGAGLGGGSSDAAFTMIGLNRLFDLGLNLDELARLSRPLGADVPFFVYNRPLLASGIGQDFEEVSLALPYRIELVTPPIHSSTVAAYKALDYTMFDGGRDLRSVLCLPIRDWRTHLENDLEVPVFQLHPEIRSYKMALYEQGALYASMSGSGSAVFGIFDA